MLDNCTYNKVKLLHNLSDACWFIENYCKEDAKKASDIECHKLMEQTHQELSNIIEKLRKSVC